MTIESWISHKTIKCKPSDIAGNGFFAVADIIKGEVLAIKAGHIIDRDTLEANRDIIKSSEMKLTDDLYLAPLTLEELPKSMVYFNHSCEPNCGIGGNILSVAMRDISAGEELTIDYALHIADPNYKMNCSCKMPSCRRTITGKDWLKPEIQDKYRGYFTWYIEQKIKALRKFSD